ncbi:MAG: VIT1/CCC1 transporter family protein [Patescibacteria group bacterium]
MLLEKEKKVSNSSVRNFVFGVEDSLVSTVGLLSGVAAAGMEKSTILLTGVVLIFVEAFSMAVGSFLSDQSAEEYAARADLPIMRSLRGALIMFVSYFVSGFIPLVPYIVMIGSQAFWYSIGLSLIALFILGAGGSYLSRVNPFKGGLQMAAIGGAAIGIGVAVGSIISL